MNELINLGNGQFVKVTMLKGEKGSNIATITKTGTSGLVDTYTVTLTDGSTTTFEVKNGKTIVSVVKTRTSGLVDTYTITYNDNTTSTFTVTNGRGIERIDKTWTSGLVDTYTITYNDETTSTFDVTNGNAESLQDAIKASSCAIKAGVSQVTFTQLGSAYITYIPNSECVENAIVVVCFDNGSMYKGTLNYSSTAGRWGISDVSLIQGSDVPATWNVGYGNDSVGTRAFRTGTDFVFSSGVGIALSTSSSVVSYYCVLRSGRVSDNYLETQSVKKSGDTMNGALNFANNTLNMLGDDCAFGDQGHTGAFCIKGTSGNTRLYMISSDGTARGSLSFKNGLFNFNKPVHFESGITCPDQISTSTILNYITNYGGQFGCMGFAGVSDAPTDGEYAVFWFGSLYRISVIAVPFIGSGKMYRRGIFGTSWYDSGWFEVPSASVSGTTLNLTL